MSEDLGLTDEQIDSLVDQKPTNEVMPESAPPEAAPVENQFKFTARGKEVEVKDLDQLKGYASKGYDYAQLIADHRLKEEQFAARQQELEQKYKQFQEVDSFAQNNPDWWENVNQAYLNRQKAAVDNELNPQSLDLAQSPEFAKIKQELDGIKQFKENYERQQKEIQQKQEDQALAQEIQSIQDHYKDLDWKTVGPDGKNLEYQVLEHAQKIGTDSFRAAFRDFYHENLVAKAEERGKEAVSREIQRNKKLGLLGETPAPLLKYKAETNPRNYSYDELENQALQELGLGQ